MKNILSGKWVIDSHILVYSLDRNSPFYPSTKELFFMIYNKQIEPYVTIQNIIEAEHTLIKKYKLSAAKVIKKIETMLEVCDFIVLAPFATTYQRFHRLIEVVERTFDVFDYFLASTMLDNGINRILTVNTKDFEKIKEIEAVNPF